MPKQILVADDSITIQRVVQMCLAHLDYEIAQARDGDEALALARKIQPAMVLADHLMPGKNGYELSAAMRAIPELRSVPVLIMTGALYPYEETRGREAGADGHIVKPFDSQSLIDRVGEMLGRGAAEARPVEAPAMPPVALPTRPAAPAAALTATAAPTIAPTLSSAATPSTVPWAARPAAASATLTFAAVPRPATAVTAPAATAPAAMVAPPIAHPAAVAPARPAEPPAAHLTLPMVPAPPLGMHAAPATPPAAAAAPPPASAVLPVFAPAVAAPAAAAPPPATPAVAAPAWISEIAPAPARQSLIPNVPVPPPAVAPLTSSEMVSAADTVATGAAWAASSTGLSHDELLRIGREIIERVAWEVVPDLAETIIREQLDRLTKERPAKS